MQPPELCLREAQRQRQQSRYAQRLGESSVKWRVWEKVSHVCCLSLSLSLSLEDQIEEALEKKRQIKVVREPLTHVTLYNSIYSSVCVTMMMSLQASPLVFFPWGASQPQRDESGKLQTRRRPNPPLPQSEVPPHSVCCMNTAHCTVSQNCVYLYCSSTASWSSFREWASETHSPPTALTPSHMVGGYWV